MTEGTPAGVLGAHGPAGRPGESAEDGWQPRQIVALVTVALTALMASLPISLPVPVLPQIARDIHSSTTSTEWLLTSTLLGAAIAVPIAGRLGDLYGKKLMLLVATFFLTVGSVICALSHSLIALVIGRGVSGLALAAVPLGISLATVTLPPSRAATGVALISAMLGIGGALALPIAGFIGEHADYHLLFWMCAVGGGLSLAGDWFLLTEPGQRRAGRFDFPGAVLLSVVLVCLLLPLSEAAVWGWGSPRTIGLLAAAAVILGAFVLLERRIASPLVDIAANAKPPLLRTNIASVCVGFALFASLIGTASYVQAPRASGYGFGASIVVSGLCLLPSGAGMLALSPVSAMMTRRFGPRITLCTGSLVVAAGFVVRIALTGQIWEIVAGTTIVGAGTGIAYAAMPALIALGAPHSELAAANGLNSLARLVGSSIASAIGGTILASTVIAVGGVAFPSLAAYRILFAICAAAAVLGAAIALLVPRPPAYSSLLLVTAERPEWRADPVQENGHTGVSVDPPAAAQPTATGSGLPPVPRPSGSDGTSA